MSLTVGGLQFGYDLGGGDDLDWNIKGVPDGEIPLIYGADPEDDSLCLADYLHYANGVIEGTGVGLVPNGGNAENGESPRLFLVAFGIFVSKYDCAYRLDFEEMEDFRVRHQVDQKLEMALNRLGIEPTVDAGWYLVATDC